MLITSRAKIILLVTLIFLKDLLTGKADLHTEGEKEKSRRKRESKKKIVHLLLHSSNNCHSQGWARLKLGARTL